MSKATITSNATVTDINSLVINGNERHCMIEAVLDSYIAENGDQVSEARVTLEVADPELAKFFKLYKKVTMADLQAGACKLSLKLSQVTNTGDLASAEVLALG